MLSEAFSNLDQAFTCALNPVPGSVAESAADNVWIPYDVFGGSYLDADDTTTHMDRITDSVEFNGQEFDAIMGDQMRTGSKTKHFRASHPADGILYFKSDSTTNLNSGYKGPAFYGMDRNFVSRDGRAGTVRRINGLGTGLTDTRFVEITNNTDLGLTQHNQRSWIPNE